MEAQNEPMVGRDDVYVPGRFKPGYNDFCPIIPAYGYFEADQFHATFFDNGVTEAIAIDAQLALVAPGFLVLELGDIQADETLSGAANAVATNLLLLFSACNVPVEHVRVRTTIELIEYMKVYRANYSHIILVGHGSTDGLHFLDRKSAVTGIELAGMLGCDNDCRELQIISLCCHSGCSNMAQSLSNAPNVSEVIAPTAVVDLRWAVVFVIGYFLKQLEAAVPIDEAVHSSAGWCDQIPMVIWRNGTQLNATD